MMAATSLEAAASKNAGLPVYPRMTPNSSESEEWWTSVDNTLNKTDHGWFVRGAIPPWLENQTTLTDLTAFTVLVVPAADTAGYLATMRHNQMVGEKQAENVARKKLMEGQTDQYAMTMASLLAAALRPHAELLLKELEKAAPLTRVTE